MIFSVFYRLHLYQLILKRRLASSIIFAFRYSNSNLKFDFNKAQSESLLVDSYKEMSRVDNKRDKQTK